jgi:hypothetical protein
MNSKTRVAILIAIIILLLGSGTFAYRAGWLWETAEQKKVEELKQQVAAQFKELNDQKKSMPRPQFFESIRQQVASLPAQYQEQFRDSTRNMFMQQMERRVDDYLKMPQNERKKTLDKQIAEFEKMRQDWQNRPAQPGGGGPPAQGGRPDGNAKSEQAEGDRPRGGPFGGGRGIGGMLDATRPEFRAKMGVYMADMQKRRKELGLPDWGPRPR